MLRRTLALGIVTAALVFGAVATPAAACACGGPAPIPGTEVDVDREVALVRWDGGNEQIVMQLDMRSDAGETGLIVPTPTPAKVTAGDPDLFDALERQVAPVEVIEEDWWGPGLLVGSGAGAPNPGSAPVVLDRVQLGPIEAATLAASDAQGLADWLDENGYALSDAIAAELPPYIEDGWSFVALKLTGDVPFDGALDPITFTFATDELVYPMRMSRAADTPQNVRLYVVDDHRAVVTHLGGDPLTTQNWVYWAGPVTEPDLSSLGSYLTVVDLHWGDPGNEITTDLGITQAPTDEVVVQQYTTVRQVQILGFPAGPFLVAAVVLLLIVAVVVLVTIRRRRAMS